jgi:nucleoid-associated protein YgaU
VQQNENYWAISQKLYGTGDYYRALAEANAAKYPREDRLQPGDVIAAPPAAELARLYPTLVPKRSPPARPEVIPAADTRPGGRVYVVQQGDTLYDIARYQLGKASRWAEVYELNRDQIGQQYDNLPAGMQLVLPEASRAGRVTQYPGAGFER